MVDGGGHAADLTVAAFDEFEFEPAVGDVLPESDGGIPGWDDGLGIEEGDAAGAGPVVLDGDAGGEFLEGIRGGNPFDLGPVGAGVATFGVEEAGVEAGFVAEEEETFGIGVESAEGVDAGWEAESGEGPVGRTIGGELAEDPVRFVEGNQHGVRRAEGEGGREAVIVRVGACPPFWGIRAAEIRDNFNDGDIAGWTAYDVFASAGVVSRHDPIGGGVRIVTTNSPAVAFGPVVGGLMRPEANWADFTVKVDFRNWTQGAGTNTTVGVLGRVSFPTVTTVNAYMATIYTGRLPFVQRGYPVSPVLLIERLDGSVKSNFGFEILPDLDPEKTYTLEFSGEGRSFLARLYEAGRPDRTLALTRADDTSAAIHTTGAVGILAMNRDTTAGFPDGPVQATFDNFEAKDSGVFVAPEPPQISPVFADDFDFEVDVSGWGSGVRVSPGVLLVARSSRNPDGTVNGYGLTLSTTATPELASTPLTPRAGLSVDVIRGSRPEGSSLVFASMPTLDPAKWYRLRFWGRGPSLAGDIRELGSSDVLASVTPTLVGGRATAVVPVGGGAQFFRLRKP